MPSLYFGGVHAARFCGGNGKSALPDAIAWPLWGKIVITHLEELKDAFPSRIEAIKPSEGLPISLS
jgi:hypothetical protein